ncbi:uncharacterized protein BDW70DRAFT_161919 [Aspergillus foveolatus]|uniref:uncharacterized protein n=1 Tax=Aspergillus foveolatus TaxID=210207 RepID=UPI003CCD915A
MPVIGQVRASLQIRSPLSTRVCKGLRSSLHRLQIASQSTNSVGANTSIEYGNGMIKQQNEGSNKGSKTVNSTQPAKSDTKYYSLKDYRERPEVQQSEGFKTATNSTKDEAKYHTLKDYREGLYTESGKLDSRRDSQERRTHNWDVNDTHKKE